MTMRRQWANLVLAKKEIDCFIFDFRCKTYGPSCLPSLPLQDLNNSANLLCLHRIPVAAAAEVLARLVTRLPRLTVWPSGNLARNLILIC